MAVHVVEQIDTCRIIHNGPFLKFGDVSYSPCNMEGGLLKNFHNCNLIQQIQVRYAKEGCLLIYILKA